MQRSMLLSELRATVTGASVDYVGSVTIHEELCDALGLLDRQMVHIRNHNSSTSSAVVDLWTYVIRGMDCPERCPPGTVCLNGAAAHLVNVGDIVTLTARGLVTTRTLVSDDSTTTASSSIVVPRRWDAVQDGVTNVMTRMGGAPSDAWAAEAVLEYACGKVHRPRITHVADAHYSTAINTGTTNDNNNNNNNKMDSNRTSNFPALVLDSHWAREGSIHEGEAIHLVNVTNGQRDIVTAQYAPAGSQQCTIHNVTTSRTNNNNVGSSNNDNINNDKDVQPGYSVGDVVIAMTYGSIARGAVMEGKAPPMRICFPFERPVYMTTVSSSKTNNESTTKAKSFVDTASPSSPTSTCSESSSSSSQGSNDGQQQQQQQEGHVDLHTLWDHSAKLKQQQELRL